MESWENKILKDKMDSLQGLPVGYNPDLGSKWEIVAAGLPEKKKRPIPLLVRWSVAATIFVCIMVAGVKIAEQKEVQAGLSTISLQPLPSLNLSTERVPETAFVAAPLPLRTKPQTKVFVASSPAKELIVKNEPLPLVNNKIKVNEVVGKIDTATIVTHELAVTIPQTEMLKRTKRRTFQKDFNDGVLVMDTSYSKPANPQFSFKFQLYKSTGDDAPPSRRLQLKQVL